METQQTKQATRAELLSNGQTYFIDLDERQVFQLTRSLLTQAEIFRCHGRVQVKPSIDESLRTHALLQRLDYPA